MTKMTYMLALSTAPIKTTFLSLTALVFLFSSLVAQERVPHKELYAMASVLVGSVTGIPSAGLESPELFSNPPVSTTTTLSSSSNPSSFGQAIVLKVQVAPLAAKGTVNFMEGTTVLGTAALDPTNTATLTTTSLSIGNHILTAVFIPKGNYSGSTSAAITQVVKQGIATTTTLSSSLNPSVSGQAVTFTASLSPAVAQASITFIDGNTQIGTATINANGIAVFTTTTLASGTHPITAVYPGNATYSASSSSILSQVVGKSSGTSTTTKISSSQNPSTVGQSVILNAQVSPSSASGNVTFSEGVTVIGTETLNGSGIASIAVSSLAVGNHNITATYNGKGTFLASVSSPLTQVVNGLPTSVSINSSLNPSNAGQPVTFTAQVTPPGATGTVNFKEGDINLGSGTLNNGVATFTTSSLSPGTHAIIAVYGGNNTFSGSSSSTLSQTIKSPVTATTTSLTSSNNPSFAFGVVTLRVHVSPSGATGTVILKEGNTTLGTATLDADGNAELLQSNFTAGNHSLIAVYNGNADYASSSSPILLQAVNKSPTNVVLGSSPNPSAAGQSVIFTADVKSLTAGNQPTGTLNIMEGALLLGSATVTGLNAINISVNNLSTGTHSISAVYLENDNYTGSSSNIINQVVNPVTINTATSLTSSVNPSNAGAPVQFTAKVVPAGVSGTVRFMEGTLELGFGILDASGSASYTTASLTTGTHSITAVYQGNANYNSSTSTALQQVVNATTSGSVRVFLTSENNILPAGAEVRLRVNVLPQIPAPQRPTGTITIREGSTVLGTLTITSGGDPLQLLILSVSSFAVGNHSLTAEYSGDVNYAASTSNVFIQAIYQPDGTPTSMLLSSAQNTSTLGQPATFTAQVAPAGARGTANLVVDGSIVSTVPLDGNGLATFVYTMPNRGFHQTSAVYLGDNTFKGSISNNLGHTTYIGVGQPTAITINSARNPSRLGYPVTFTIELTPAAANGQVNIMDGSTLLRVTSVQNGSVNFQVNAFTEGVHNLTAIFLGSDTYKGSVSQVLSQEVNLGTPTATTILSSANPSAKGLPVTFTATVTPSGTSGLVYFFDNGDNVGVKSVNASGKASITTSGLTQGSHNITAVYQGDETYQNSNSLPLIQTINAATGIPTSTTLTTNPEVSLAAHDIIFTAHVNPAGVTGVVQFMNMDNGAVFGTANLDMNGNATFKTNSFPSGTYQFAAVYLGDQTYSGSTSNTANQYVSQDVIQTTTMIFSSTPSSTVGETVTFFADVRGNGGPRPTGTVTFMDGNVVLGASGNTDGRGYSIQTAALAAGNHSITAVYVGQGAFEGSTSTPLSFDVTVPAAMMVSTIRDRGAGNSGITSPKETGNGTQGLEIIVLRSNPSRATFTLKINSNNKSERIQFRTVDLYGKTLEVQQARAGQTIQLGGAYRQGVYFVEAVQGRIKRTVKLIKL